MTVLLDIALSTPTVLFTVPLGFVVVYWLSVLAGGVDVDGLDGVFDGAEGAFDGLDGALDGVDLDMDVDVDVDVDVDADAEALNSTTINGPLYWLARALRLGKVPLTVSLSLFVLGCWMASGLLTQLLHGGPGVPLSAGVAVGVGLAALVVGMVFASAMTAPLEPVFRTTPARERTSLLGEVCVISTGRVDGAFGQATVMLGSDDLLFQVRCDQAGHGMVRGSSALIVSFDEAREAYVVEPLAPGAAEQLTAQRIRPSSTFDPES